MALSGEADAYGHRKLGGIGLLLGEAIKAQTGEDIIYQQVAYLMRSGSPDSLDLMVATNYAVMAADLALEGASGRMVALRNGSYTTVPISRDPRGREARRHRRALRRRASTGRRSVTSPASRCSCTEARAMRDRDPDRWWRLPRPERRDPRCRRAPPRMPWDRDVGIRNGWQGLMADDVRAARPDAVRGIVSRGGTILGTSRFDPYVHGDGLGEPPAVARAARDRRPDRDRWRRDALAPRCACRGGAAGRRRPEDDRQRHRRAPTSRSASTPRCSIATEAIDRLTTTAEAHHRVMLVEVMGRTKGWIATPCGDRERCRRDPRPGGALRSRGGGRAGSARGASGAATTRWSSSRRACRPPPGDGVRAGARRPRLRAARRCRYTIAPAAGGADRDRDARDRARAPPARRDTDRASTGCWRPASVRRLPISPRRARFGVMAARAWRARSSPVPLEDACGEIRGVDLALVDVGAHRRHAPDGYPYEQAAASRSARSRRSAPARRRARARRSSGRGTPARVRAPRASCRATSRQRSASTSALGSAQPPSRRGSRCGSRRSRRRHRAGTPDGRRASGTPRGRCAQRAQQA